MICPKCGHEQSDGWLSCQKCHIIFSRWKPESIADGTHSTVSESASPASSDAALERQRPSQMFGDPPPEPARPPDTKSAVPASRRPSWLLNLMLLLLAAAALWWVLNPKGLPIEPDSYTDAKGHFAIRAPEGWLTLTKENYDAIIREYGARLPANLVQAMNSQGLAVSFVRPSQAGGAGEFAPSLNVVTVMSAPPAINEKSKLEAAQALAGGFAAVFNGYEQESVEIIEVDKIRSLEIVSTAAVPLLSAGEDENSVTLALRFRQVLVPGKKQAYFLTCTAPQDAGEDTEESFQRAIQSFRVFKRPPRFSPVINGGLVGGLVGFFLFMLSGMIRSFGKDERGR